MLLSEIKSIHTELETLTEQELNLLLEGFLSDTARKFLSRLGGKLKRAAIATILAISAMSISVPAFASVEDMVFSAAAKGYTPAQISMVVKDTKRQIADDCISLAVYNNIVKMAIQKSDIKNKDQVIQKLDAKTERLLDVAGKVYGPEAKARITVEFQRQTKLIGNDLSKIDQLNAEIKPKADEINDLSGATLERLVDRNLEKITPAP